MLNFDVLLFISYLVFSFHHVCNIKYYAFQMSSLLAPLVQLVKTGFTKAVQRLDGIYALLLVGKIAAVDLKAGVDCIFLSFPFYKFLFLELKQFSALCSCCFYFFCSLS